MNRLQEILKESNNEAVTTRKMLAIVPDDKFDWKPHPKSMSIRQLAGHIAELPSWIGMVLNTTELDFAENEYQAPDINFTETLLALFETNHTGALAQLNAAKEETLDEEWVLRNGETIYSKTSKADFIRITLSQIIHHRAQLGVFLRLLDVPIPGSYGPSADEVSFN
ncbi:MAG: DinB family protein [Rhizobacter sp.]|nr:DinB family protein [Ferruginibacter sp.]